MSSATTFHLSTFQKFKNDRQHGQHDNRQDYVLKIRLHKRKVAKEVSQHRKRRNPNDPTDDVEDRELPISHSTHPRNKGRISSDDGNKTRKNYCLTAVAVIELFGFLQVITIQPSLPT